MAGETAENVRAASRPVAPDVEQLTELALRDEKTEALAAVAGLGGLRSVEAARALQEVAERAASKEVRKEARRALHRLRAVGVVVEDAHPVVATLHRPALNPFAAQATSVDGAGHRLLFIGLEAPGGTAYLLQALLHEVDGLQDFSIRDTSRRRITTWLAEQRAGRGRDDQGPALVHVEVPVRYALHLLAEAVGLAEARGRSLPHEFLAWRDRLPRLDEPVERALVYEELSAAEARLAPNLLDASPAVLEEPECLAWAFAYEEMQPYLADLRRRQQSVIVLSGQAEGEQQENVLRRAISELVTPERRQGLKRRLEETALIFLRTGRELAAKRALAAAVHLDAGSGTLLTLHPFVRALVERSIAWGVTLQAMQTPEARRQSPLWVPD